jgi:glycosyltransferase involved in cell wall biosynthesis
LLAFAEYLRLTDRHGDTLCIVGGGPDEGRLRKLARDLDIRTTVSFLGPKPAPELADLVASSDIAVLPSDHEGFGLTVFEGLACGKPVITSAKGAPREFLHDGVEVIMVERDKSAIASAMVRLALDEGLRLEIARNGRRRALQFSWSEVTRQYFEVYAEVLGIGRRVKGAMAQSRRPLDGYGWRC